MVDVIEGAAQTVAFAGAGRMRMVAPGRRGLTHAFPRAEVRVARNDDGRWMWAVSFFSRTWGFGYAPLPKCGNFAADREAALARGVDELLDRLLKKKERGKDECEVIAWLETLKARKQGDLFMGAKA